MNINNRIGQYLQDGRVWFTRNVNTIKVFSIHHDAIPHGKSADEALNQIYSEHKQRGWPGASYHYYIHSDGQIYQLNRHEWVTWVDGRNWDCIGIVLNGYFHPNINNSPTPEQLKSLKELLDDLSTNHPEFPASKKDVYGHRERASTACPGDKFCPYVKEYRGKEGAVDWGQIPPVTPPISDDEKRALDILRKAQQDFNHGNLEGTAAALRGAADDLPKVQNDLNKANEKLAQIKAVIEQ